MKSYAQALGLATNEKDQAKNNTIKKKTSSIIKEKENNNMKERNKFETTIQEMSK